jgi:hypothetical protein
MKHFQDRILTSFRCTREQKRVFASTTTMWLFSRNAMWLFCGTRNAYFRVFFWPGARGSGWRPPRSPWRESTPPCPGARPLGHRRKHGVGDADAPSVKK